MPSVVDLLPATTTHVIWDFNGTLVEDVELVLSITNAILEPRGLPAMERERYRELFVFPVSDYYAKIGLPGEGEAFKAVADVFAKNFEEGMSGCELRADVVPGLMELSARGVSSSLLSASRQASLDELATHFGLRDLVTEVCGIDDHYAHGKIGSGKKWIEKSNHKPEQIVMVGDTEHDHEVAQALGTECILVSYGHTSRERLLGCGCPVADSIYDV